MERLYMDMEEAHQRFTMSKFAPLILFHIYLKWPG